MQKVEVKKEKYLVCFMPHDFDGKDGFWEKLFCFALNRLKKNFSHVSIYKQGIVPWEIIEINPASNNIFINEITKQQMMNILLSPNITHLVVEAKTGTIKAKGLITCVSVVKAILGIDKASIITPYQLYKFLEKNYGKEKS